MASSKIYLITGASRGIGKEFTSKLLLRSNTTVIAAVRDVTKASPVLHDLPKAKGSKLIVVKLDSQVDTDAEAAVSKLKLEHGITSLDIVIASAGIAHSGTTVSNTSVEALRDHVNTNTIGPITLFQAVSPLLKASEAGNPIFLPLTTILSSIGAQDFLTALRKVFSPYGASKAALNWTVQRIHREETWLIAFVVHPGLVLTDMGSALIAPGSDPATYGAITVEESVGGLLKIVDEATRETHGGTFKNHDGSTLPW